jgi:hypothetical protein
VRQQGPPKRCSPTESLHSVTTPKTTTQIKFGNGPVKASSDGFSFKSVNNIVDSSLIRLTMWYTGFMNEITRFRDITRRGTS